jgi:streptogramin lyase
MLPSCRRSTRLLARAAAAAALAGALAAPRAAQAQLVGVDFDDGTLYAVSITDASVKKLASTEGITSAASLELAPDGKLVCTRAGTGELFRIDPATGKTTLAGRIAHETFEGGIAFAPEGTMYVSNGGNSGAAELLTVNLATAAWHVVGVLDGGAHDINGLAWRSDGMLVGLDRVTNALLVIDPRTAHTKLLAPVGAKVGGLGGMAVYGGRGYFSTAGPGASEPGASELYAFDLFTGATARVGPLGAPVSASGLGGLAVLPQSAPAPAAKSR